MALLVNLMRGMEDTCPAVLPSCHIGSTADEMTGPNVILSPHRRKENQCVMNHQQSTSISGKHHPENHKGEGSTPRSWRQCTSNTKLIPSRQHALDLRSVGVT